MLGFITGSGYYNLDSLRNADTLIIDTPYGAVSLTRASWNDGAEVLFLPRHGTDHSVAPHLINYRANIWALHEAGATAIVATSVSGAIATDMNPGDFVIIDDFIDFTTGRASTFFDTPGSLKHADMSNPYDEDLRIALAEAAASARVPVRVGGTYCATNGPRFETKAEIAMMARVGGDLVGMTGCPEVVLANEIGLPYAGLGVISNMAAGLGETEFTIEEIMKVLADAAWPLELLLGDLVERYTP